MAYCCSLPSFRKERENEHVQNKQYCRHVECLSYFKPFTSNDFWRNNEAYKLYYTFKER